MKQIIIPGNLIQYDVSNIFYLVINTTEQYMSVIRLEISDYVDIAVRYTGDSTAMSYIAVLK